MGEIRDAIDKGPGSLRCATTQLLSMSGEKISAVAQLFPSGDAQGGIEMGGEREFLIKWLRTALLLLFFTRAAF